MQALKTDWKKVKVGELCRIKHGYAFKGKYFSDRGKYIVLTPGNFTELDGLKLKGDREKYYTDDFPKQYLLKSGQMLVVMTDLKQSAPYLGAPGIVKVDDALLHNQRLGLITDVNDELIEGNFLYWIFQSHNYRSQVRGSASGATVRHTSPERIYDCVVEIPKDKNLQVKIASILSAFDNLIENNTKRIKLLEKTAQLIYKEWFVNFRFPGHADINMTESGTEFGSIPVRWSAPVFTEKVDVMSGGTPQTSVPEYWDGQIPFFTPKDVDSAFYTLQTEKKITQLGLAKCNSKLYSKNTIFITARGTVGKCALAPFEMAMNQSCYALSATKSGISNLYLYLFVLGLVEGLKKQAIGGVFDTITVATFEQLRLLLPDEEILTKFEATIQPVFDEILILQTFSIYLEQTRDFLLPHLINP